MFIASRHSKEKIFHTQTCPYAKRIIPDNQIHFSTADDALRAGFSPCKHCNAVFRNFRKEQSKIYSFCASNGLQIFEKRHNLHVRTSQSAWFIVPGTKQMLRLFHKNKENRKSNALEKRFPGYHDQHVSRPDILSCLQYILRHDAYRRLNPHAAYIETPPPKKGTKRYRKWKKAQKARNRRHQIGNVLSLIESL